jgi:kinetochore protein Mis13/DSN1
LLVSRTRGCAGPDKALFARFQILMLTTIKAYDEEDGDFVFTRGAKRTKTAPTEPQPTPAPAPPAKKTRKTKEKEHDAEPVTTVKKPRGRKMSFSTPKEPDTITLPKRRKSTRRPADQQINGESSTRVNDTDSIDYDAIDMVGASAAEEPSRSTVEVTKQTSVIALPFSDTPIINRNKELRKKGNGTRRSSLGMRGRRASSLIDNGHSAIPHREVDTVEFYKHIEADGLSEPRRMKQLLTWVGERALGEKPSHGDPDSAAYLAGTCIYPL